MTLALSLRFCVVTFQDFLSALLILRMSAFLRLCIVVKDVSIQSPITFTKDRAPSLEVPPVCATTSVILYLSSNVIFEHLSHIVEWRLSLAFWVLPCFILAKRFCHSLIDISHLFCYLQAQECLGSMFWVGWWPITLSKNLLLTVNKLVDQLGKRASANNFVSRSTWAMSHFWDGASTSFRETVSSLWLASMPSFLWETEVKLSPQKPIVEVDGCVSKAPASADELDVNGESAADVEQGSAGRS